MAAPRLEPHLVMADQSGNIYDDPQLLMVCRRGAQWGLPRPDELMPLPEESELFLLPGRRAVGLNPESGETEVLDQLAVAAFAAPAHTLSAHPAYESETDAPLLPLFAYGAVGFAHGRFYVCARKVDQDPRQRFQRIPRGRIEQNVRRLLREHPDNRLIRHILDNCVLRYDCPAARNFALGRYEAPLRGLHLGPGQGFARGRDAPVPSGLHSRSRRNRGGHAPAPEPGDGHAHLFLRPGL